MTTYQSAGTYGSEFQILFDMVNESKISMTPQSLPSDQDLPSQIAEIRRIVDEYSNIETYPTISKS